MRLYSCWNITNYFILLLTGIIYVFQRADISAKIWYGYNQGLDKWWQIILKWLSRMNKVTFSNLVSLSV